MVGLLVARFDVEQDEVDQVEELLAGPVAEETGGVDGGVQAELLLAPAEEHLEEVDLHHRLATADGDAAARGGDERRVLLDLVHHPPDGDPSAVADRPHVGVRAVLAAQRTTGEEECETHTRPVDRPGDLIGVVVPDLRVAFLGEFGLQVGPRPAEVFPHRRDREPPKVGHDGYSEPWNVRCTTSICCSFVRRTKLTA